MKKVLAATFGILLMVLLISNVEATGVCATRTVVQHAAVITTFAPVPVLVPTYSVGYAPGADNSQLLAEIQNLRKEIEALKAQNNNNPQLFAPAPKEHPAIAIMKKSCASCHDQTAAKNKGGSFQMFDLNGLTTMSDKQALSIAREVYSGRMPKNGKISDEDVGQIMNWLDTIK